MAVKAPEGTFDLLPDDVRFWDHFRQTAFEIFGRCGYQPIETPLFEQTDPVRARHRSVHRCCF